MRRELLIAALLTTASPLNSQPVAPTTSAQPTLTYPKAKAVDVVETQFGVPVADPYRWLENDVRNDPEVAAWVAAQGLDAGDPASYPREREHILLARVLLAQGETRAARRLLERLQAAAAAQQRHGSVIELGALRARVLSACGDRAGALAALAEALALAWPQGYVRVFTGEGPALAAVLDQLIAARRRGGTATAGVPWEYLDQLHAAFRPGEARPAGSSTTPAALAAGLVEPLTDRELEVLGLLGAGLANLQIARKLVVAPETAKKHVSHILGKLGAANRTQAAARARELGLLR